MKFLKGSLTPPPNSGDNWRVRNKGDSFFPVFSRGVILLHPYIYDTEEKFVLSSFNLHVMKWGC